VPIHGTFTEGVFHARWADYRADRVDSWHASEAEQSAPAAQAPDSSFAAALARTLKRWSSKSAATAHPG